MVHFPVEQHLAGFNDRAFGPEGHQTRAHDAQDQGADDVDQQTQPRHGFLVTNGLRLCGTRLGGHHPS